MKKYFVTGIGTGVGKTLVSAILVEKLKADYWKPIQSGDLDHTDTDTVRNLVTNPDTVYYPEAYRLNHPLSPHHSAALDGLTIDPAMIKCPATSGASLIIEGAGGLMVPLNDTYMMIDLARDLAAEIILVSGIYLGSINHTLLSVEAIRQRNLPFAGIVFNGEPNPESERIIISYTGARDLGHIPQYNDPDKQFVKQCTTLLNI